MPTFIIPDEVADFTGQREASDAIANWARTVGGGKPWRTLKLRPDGRYRCDRGLVIRNLNFGVFDFNGADILVSGTGDGLKPHDDDFQMWPRGRTAFRLKDSWATTVRSTRPGARIHGGHTAADWSVGWAVGVTFDPRYEAQHGFQFSHCRDCRLDLRAPDGKSLNMEISHVRGDLVNHTNYSSGCVTIGARDDLKAHDRVWNELLGPGLHHCGRQGLNVDSGSWGARFIDLPVWQVKRSWLDLEPGGGGTIYDTLLQRCLVGSFQGNWIAAGGDGHVNKVRAEHCHGNRAKGLCVFSEDRPSPWRGEPKRREDWALDDIWSEALWGSPVALLRFGLVDGVSITNFHHRISDRQGGRATYFNDCTKVVDQPNFFDYVH